MHHSLILSSVGQCCCLFRGLLVLELPTISQLVLWCVQIKTPRQRKCHHKYFSARVDYIHHHLRYQVPGTTTSVARLVVVVVVVVRVQINNIPSWVTPRFRQSCRDWVECYEIRGSNIGDRWNKNEKHKQHKQGEEYLFCASAVFLFLVFPSTLLYRTQVDFWTTPTQYCTSSICKVGRNVWVFAVHEQTSIFHQDRIPRYSPDFFVCYFYFCRQIHPVTNQTLHFPQITCNGHEFFQKEANSQRSDSWSQAGSTQRSSGKSCLRFTLVVVILAVAVVDVLALLLIFHTFHFLPYWPVQLLLCHRLQTAIILLPFGITFRLKLIKMALSLLQ